MESQDIAAVFREENSTLVSYNCLSLSTFMAKYLQFKGFDVSVFFDKRLFINTLGTMYVATFAHVKRLVGPDTACSIRLF